jgi:hypothetical protein
MESIQSFLEYHAIEGGELSPEYARELVLDASDGGMTFDVQKGELAGFDFVAASRSANNAAIRFNRGGAQ